MKPLLAEQSGQSIMESTTSVRNGEFACDPAPLLRPSGQVTQHLGGRGSCCVGRSLRLLGVAGLTFDLRDRPAGAFGQSGDLVVELLQVPLTFGVQCPVIGNSCGLLFDTGVVEFVPLASQSGKSVGRKRLGLAQPPLG